MQWGKGEGQDEDEGEDRAHSKSAAAIGSDPPQVATSWATYDRKASSFAR